MPLRSKAAVLFLVTLMFSTWHLDQGQNANTVSRAASVAALVEQGTWSIDAFADLTNDRARVNGRYYSEKAPLPALCVVPFHWVLRQAELIGVSEGDHINVDLLRLGGALCGSLPFAVIVVLCWLNLQRRTPERSGVPLVWAMFFGSFLFIYSGTFFGHLMGAAFALGALHVLERGRHGLAGALTGCAVLSDYPLLLFAGCWTLHLAITSYRSAGSPRALLRFVGGALPFAAALVLYNSVVFGAPFSVGYDHLDAYASENGIMIEGLRPEALFGLTLSPYRGLIPHMPVLALGLVAWALAARKEKHTVGLLVSIPAVLTLLFASSVGMWWGGWAFGPRHLTTVAALLAYRTLPRIAALPWSRVPLILLGFIGLAYAFMAKSTVWYSLPTGILRPFSSIILPKLEGGVFTTSQWPVVLGASPLLGTVLFLLSFGAALVLLHRLFKPSDHAPLPLP
ncbi:MAG TPA: hypothetical protein PLR96_09890 [Flavobacteriales bacterium]|nr:hypothetical protein [Flavobacteriales bacterium]